MIPHSNITLEHIPPSALERQAAQIFSIERITNDIAKVRLKLVSGRAIAFKPGQFIGVRWLGSQLKYFSIASIPDTSAFIELHVRKQSDGGFTQWLFCDATTADVIGIEGPIGDFGWITPPYRPVILLATGTGFSPLKSLIEGHRLWEHSAGVHFYWGGRYKADLYDDELARSWGKKSHSFIYDPVLSRETSGTWSGRAGRIPAAVLNDHSDLSGFDIYACGSPEMIAQARQVALSAGLPPERFFADSFESTNRVSGIQVVNLNIEFLGSTLRGRIRSPVGVSLLQALTSHGLNLDHYCGGGAVCATCLVNVASVQLRPPAETEADLLDCLVHLTHGDRLACQLTVTTDLDNVSIRLPGHPGHISRLEEQFDELKQS
jgi:CDP-4-dehydro-6-deoxyglucose reductase